MNYFKSFDACCNLSRTWLPLNLKGKKGSDPITGLCGPEGG